MTLRLGLYCIESRASLGALHLYFSVRNLYAPYWRYPINTCPNYILIIRSSSTGHIQNSRSCGHIEINKKTRQKSEDMAGSSRSAQSLFALRSESDDAVVTMHHGHRHRTVSHHETSEVSHQLPRFPSGCVIGNGGVKSDAVGIAELVAESLSHLGLRRRRSDDVSRGDLDIGVGCVAVGSTLTHAC